MHAWAGGKAGAWVAGTIGRLCLSAWAKDLFGGLVRGLEVVSGRDVARIFSLIRHGES